MTTYVPRCGSCQQPWYGNPGQICNECKIIQQQKAQLDLQQSRYSSRSEGGGGPFRLNTVWEDICICLPPVVYSAVVLWAVMHFMIGVI